MIEKFKEAFREEATELLNNLENTLLILESDPRDNETISAVFRTMHTIKGSSSMFGFDEISRFTHEVESIMDLLREGAFVADRRLIDLTLKARDLISSMLASDGVNLDAEAAALIKDFKEHSSRRIAERETELSSSSELPPLPPSQENAEGGEPSAAYADASNGPGVPARAGDHFSRGNMETWRIRFVPATDVFMNGTKPLLLLDELRNLGTASIVPLADAIPPLSEMDPEKCYVGWEITLTTDKGEDAVRDVFIFVEGSCELLVERIAAEENAEASEPDVMRLGEILVDRGIATPETIRNVVEGQKRLGELLVEEKVATSEQVKSALDEQDHLKKLKDSRQQEPGTSSIRVASDKLDALVDLVGELVTLQARLSRTASNILDPALAAISEQLERLISQLRDNTMSIRMLPIGSTFSKFRRVVRDLSAELGKEIELTTMGAETELDKTVIEKLNDPLVHIIRNSVDHGIETPGEREAAGKNRQGVVSLSAMHSGAHVLISIADDGGGLDIDRIRAKAVERGLTAPNAVLSTQELYQMIFAPGFSTAKNVTSVSGRGVGMDVVKREIDSLGGSVSVESQRGRGTSVTLKIPLTLAIIEGLLVRIGDERFVFPLSSVDGCIELDRENREAGRGERNITTYRNEILPFISIRELFGVAGEAPGIEQIVVVNALETRMGFIVDEVIGDNQTVIKPLGRMFKASEGLSGATILGDGSVALIIDVNRLAVSAQHEESLRLNRDKESVAVRE